MWEFVGHDLVLLSVTGSSPDHGPARARQCIGASTSHGSRAKRAASSTFSYAPFRLLCRQTGAATARGSFGGRACTCMAAPGGGWARPARGISSRWVGRPTLGRSFLQWQSDKLESGFAFVRGWALASISTGRPGMGRHVCGRPSGCVLPGFGQPGNAVLHRCLPRNVFDSTYILPTWT